MKLRIKGNTIRFRLTKSEVEYFGNIFYLEEKTEFGNNSLTYALSTSDQKNISATFNNHKIEINIPKHIAQGWTSSNRVGIDGEIEIADNKKLYVLIEKDFKCLDDTLEDQSDNYENPSASDKK
jgi:hypothetical protein